MSRDGSVELDFAGERRKFRLAWGELELLQESRETGPYILLDRLLSGHWRVQDIAEVIRLGLIGGGARPDEAQKLVKAYVQARPPLETLVIAQRVLGAGVAGTPDEELGKKAEAANPDGNSPNSQTENSDLPPSTATGP